MTDQRDKAIDEPAGGVAVPAAAGQPANLSRRALLRGATIAAPAILTMSTASAALAASSVRTYTSVTTAQGDGKYYCLAEKTTLGPPINGNPNALQVGSAQTPVVYSIPERNYSIAQNNSGSNAITEQQMCRTSALDGTTYYYSSSGWQPVKVRRGILMSAAAMGSLGVTAVPIDNF